MAASAGFCTKCGAQLEAGSTFCPRCGAAVAAEARTRRTERREKREKNEKREKGEKHEKGSVGSMLYAFVGGGILIWLGITYFLEQNGYVPNDVWGSYFLAGVGVILILNGIVLYNQRRVGFAQMAGGACALALGAGSIIAHEYNYPQAAWPLVLVGLGALVIVLGIWARRRAPMP